MNMDTDVINEQGWTLAEKRKKFGVKNNKGKLIIPIKYLYISPFIDGLAIVKYKSSIFSEVRWGIINEEGQEHLFSTDYEEIKILNGNLLAVRVSDENGNLRWGLINKFGYRITKPKYDDCPGIFKSGLAIVSCDGLCALINDTGYQICSAKYERIDITEEGLITVWREGKSYRMNRSGAILKEPKI